MAAAATSEKAAENPARATCCDEGRCCGGCSGTGDKKKKCCGSKCCWKSCAKWLVGFALSAVVGLAASRGLDMLTAAYIPQVAQMVAAAPAGLFRTETHCCNYLGLWHPIVLAFIVSLLAACRLCPLRTVMAFALFTAPSAAFGHAVFNVRGCLVLYWCLHMLITVFLEAVPFLILHGRRSCCGGKCSCDAKPETAEKKTQ